MRSNVYSTISRLSRGCQYLPRSYWINPETVKLRSEPHTSGTCAAVYCGTQDDKSVVAVKVLRTSGQEDPATLRKVSARGPPGSLTHGHGLTGRETAFLQGGNCLETRLVSVRPQVRRRVLPQWPTSHGHTLDGPWKHHRISRERRRCGSVASSELSRPTSAEQLAHFAPLLFSF